MKYRELKECPWCGSKEKESIYPLSMVDGSVYKCRKCGLVYSQFVLTDEGLQEYWSGYESRVHNSTEELVEERKKQYAIDYQYLKQFMLFDSSDKSVLDIGCGNGMFLDYFHEDGFACKGVEFGREAYEKCSEKYPCYYGGVDAVPDAERYDVIVFRGVIQYLLNPRNDMAKAAELLKDDGVLFISGSNSDSLCFRLFKDGFTQPVAPTDYYMFNRKLLSDFFESRGIYCLDDGNFYLGTPYEHYSEDIARVRRALKYKAEGRNIDFKSPAFFNNMMTLVFKKLL